MIKNVSFGKNRPLKLDNIIDRVSISPGTRRCCDVDCRSQQRRLLSRSDVDLTSQQGRVPAGSYHTIFQRDVIWFKIHLMARVLKTSVVNGVPWRGLFRVGFCVLGSSGCTAGQSRTMVTCYFSSKQLLPFGFSSNNSLLAS